MFEKLKQNLTNAGDSALHGQIETIRNLVMEHAGPKLNEISQDEQKLKNLLKNVYTVLPGPVRLAVKEDKFVDFCFAHKDQVLAKIT